MNSWFVPGCVAAVLLSRLIGGRLCKRFADRMFSTELSHFGDARDRKAALDNANPFSASKSLWRYPLPLVQGLAAGTIATLLVLLLRIPSSVPDALAWGSILFVIFVLTMLIELWSARRAITRALRERLIAEGTIVCRRCGYDLRGQIEQRCPECGCATESLGKEDCDMGP